MALEAAPEGSKSAGLSSLQATRYRVSGSSVSLYHELSDGSEHLLELDASSFSALRYNTAALLLHMEALRRNSALNMLQQAQAAAVDPVVPSIKGNRSSSSN